MSVLTRWSRKVEDDRLTIESMRRRHLPEVMAIEQRSYPRPWTSTVFESELELARRGERVYVVARRRGAVVGYGGMMMVDGAGHVTNVATHHEHRRQRLGTRLLAELTWMATERGCTAMTLEVRVTNSAARVLYERFGYTQVGTRLRYYENTDDAAVMWCTDIASDRYLSTLRALCPEAAR
jgi:ribosomal-protein-alanine N-acetyltransferase